MKKFLSILLSLVMILPLCACGGSGEKTPETPANLQIGFSRINVTPTYDVSLHGYGEEKLRDAVLYAKDLKDRYTVLWLFFLLFRNNPENKR